MTDTIQDVASDLGFVGADVQPWGPDVLKVRPEIAFRGDPSRARLVLVSAISPTPAGEGKTTCTIGLAQAARRLGRSAACALREPSLGPVFGVKGGGTGGGQATLEPSARINLHFTGDIHAITSAHNLLSALVDNDCYFRRQRDRAAARSAAGDVAPRARHERPLPPQHGHRPRRQGDGRAARGRLRHHRGERGDGDPVPVARPRRSQGAARPHPPRLHRDGSARLRRATSAEGAMAALLRDALLPNLVQTTEGAPALVHGGPFGNIAHGCNSIVATRLAMRLADFVFTEAGFGFDLGGEKFLDIKCRAAGIWPHAVVLVATLRALKLHGGVAGRGSGPRERARPWRRPGAPREALESVAPFGLEPVVALNVRAGDHDGGARLRPERLRESGVDAAGRRLRQGRRRRDGARRAVVARAKAARRSRASSTSSRSARGEDPQGGARRSTARTTSTSRSRRSAARARGEDSASASCRCAWRRPTSRSSDDDKRSAARATSTSPCARCASPPARASSSL